LESFASAVGHSNNSIFSCKKCQEEGRKLVHREAAMQVSEKLGPLDPYFTKLAKAMVVWIEAWRELNPQKAASDVAAPVKVTENSAAKTSVPLSNGSAKA
jgi:hypothetical protein